MADNKVLLEFSDEAIKTSLDQAVNDLKKISKESKEAGKALNDGIGQGAKSIKDFNKATKDAVKSANDLGDAVEESNKKFKESSEEVKNSIRNFSLFGVSVGDVENKFKSLAGIFAPLTNRIKGFLRYARDFRVFGTSIGELATGFRGMASGVLASNKAVKLLAGGFKLLKAALVSTGIGALVVALGSVVAYLTSTQKGIDGVRRAFAAVGAVVDVFIDRLSSLGGALIQFFKGDLSFAELRNEISSSFKGIGAEIASEGKEAAKLTGELQKIRDEQAALEVAYAEARAEIKEYNKDAEDVTKSLNERAEAARKAIDLESKFVDENIKLLERQKAAQEGLNALGNSLFEDEQAVRDLNIEIAAKKQESLELQTTLTNKLNVIESERQRRLEAQAAAIAKQEENYQKLVETLERALSGSEADPRENLRQQYELALNEIDKLEKELIQAAKDAGKEVDFADDFAKLRAAAYREFRQAVQDIDAQFNSNAIEPLSEATRISDNQGDEIEAIVKRNTERAAFAYRENQRDVVAAARSIGEKVAEALGLTDEEFQALRSSIGEAISTITNEITSITDAQIDENQRLIDALTDRRQRVQEEIDRELRAAELGYANNVDAKKKELEEIAKQEEIAQKKAEKLAKQRARQQLAIDAARQASGLATTAVNIFSNESLKGVAGFIFALAAVSTLFSTFASIKKQASAATVPNRLYKGGPVRDFGMIQERGGRSDVPGRNRGHMVEGTNLMLGGREFVTKEEVSREHKGFLTHLNENPHLYRGHDLQELFLNSKTFDYDRINRDFRHDRKIISHVSRKRQEENVSRAIVEAIKEQTLQLLPAIKDGEQLFIDNGKLITVTKNRSGKSIQIKALKS